MIIYNVTVSLEKEIKDDWLKWMKNEHVPEVMKLGTFTKAQINKIISNPGNECTYCIAYTCKTTKDLHKYQTHFALKLQKKHNERYGEKAITFRTLMEIVKIF